MKILVLDKDTATVNDDISLDGFNQFGEVVVYGNLTDPEKIIALSQDTDIIVVNKVVLNSDLIAGLSSRVKLIAITATGYDNVDILAAASRGIKVANVPGYGTNAVAQLTIFLILACATQFVKQLDYMRDRGWDKLAGLELIMYELSGKTLGIVGLGEIGIAVAKLAQAFGMKVLAYNRSIKEVTGINQVSLMEIAQQSDFVSLHSALNSATAKMIDSTFLSKMKSSAYIINTARGGLIDEDGLICALKNKHIAGAALDVLINEPPLPDNQLLKLDNVILTPHIGWAPVEARQRCIDLTVKNVAGFINGTPSNLLN